MEQVIQIQKLLDGGFTEEQIFQMIQLAPAIFKIDAERVRAIIEIIKLKQQLSDKIKYIGIDEKNINEMFEKNEKIEKYKITNEDPKKNLEPEVTNKPERKNSDLEPYPYNNPDMDSSKRSIYDILSGIGDNPDTFGPDTSGPKKL